MFYLILTFCSSAAMDNCMVYRDSAWHSQRQCEVMASISRDSLRTQGHNPHFRVECVYAP